ncbi:MAG: glutathione S-transferase [Deltaproteobacteria bacterium]|jgi:glutathione S-transferase|nr:glutathione S-transferase [Deltaproteobacteria bacterium]
MSTTPLRILGAPGSPYSRKLRAVLRYRRIPHTWKTVRGPGDPDIPKVPVHLMPILVFPGEEGGEDRAAIDTSPLIRELEGRYEGRSVVPTDPVLAFLDALIEDYGDEWVTKMMFHYRWSYAPDIEKAGALLPRWGHIDVPDSKIAPMSKMICERQIERLWVVGSNETTGPVIEASYRRFLRLLDARLTEQPYVLGQRPASADFALFGQLTQLVLVDPTPAAIALEESPRVCAWVEVTEDLSGIAAEEEGWIRRDDVPETLRALLTEIGRGYVPFMLANAAALTSGAEKVECEVDGQRWVQKPFPYQGKCLGWLREHFASLSDQDRRAALDILEGTGCEALVA